MTAAKMVKGVSPTTVLFMTRRSWWPAITLILIVASVYAPHLGQTIEYDEAYTLRHFAISPAYALLDYSIANNHPFHSLLVWMTTSIAGYSLVAIRFPAFAAGLLSIAFVFRVTSKTSGSAAGIASVAFLATNVTFAKYGWLARGYSLSVLLTLSCLELIMAPAHRNVRLRKYLLIANSACLVLTLPSLAILTGCMFVWCVWKNRDLVPPIVIGTISGAAFYMPSALVGRFVTPITWYGNKNVSDLLIGWVQDTFLSPPGIGILMAGSVVVGLAWLFYNRKPFLTIAMTTGLVVAILVPVQLVFLRVLFYSRNYLFLLPFLAVIGGAGMSTALRRFVWVGWLCILLVGLLPISNLRLTSDVDVLKARIKEYVGPSDVVLIGCCYNEPVWYYLGHGEQARMFLPTSERQHIFVVETELQSRDEILASYSISETQVICQQADRGWEPFEVSICIYR